MRKKLLFLTTMLLLFAASCQREEFNAERSRELASLHKNASDYTESEIREIEMQMDLYLSLNERMMDEVLSEKDSFEMQRKIVKFAAWCSKEDENVETMTELTGILRDSPYTDPKKKDSFSRRVAEIRMTIEFIQKQMR